MEGGAVYAVVFSIGGASVGWRRKTTPVLCSERVEYGIAF